MVTPETLGQARAAGGEADIEGRFRCGRRVGVRGLVAHVTQCRFHAGVDLGGPVRVGHGRAAPGTDDGQEIDQQRQRIGGEGGHPHFPPDPEAAADLADETIGFLHGKVSAECWADIMATLEEAATIELSTAIDNFRAEQEYQKGQFE